MSDGLVGVAGHAGADLQAVGLIVRAVGAGHDFLVRLGTRQPRFEVVLAAGHGAHVSGADVDHFVVEAEGVPQVDAVLKQFLVKVPRALGIADHDLLHLAELVHAPNAAVGLAVCPDLSPEAVGHADQTQREVLFRHGLAHVHRRERMLARGRHVVAVGLDAVHHGLKVTKVGHALVGGPVHHHWRLHEGVTALAEEIDRVGGERHFHAREVALEVVEAAPGDLGRTLEVDPAVHFDEVVVRAWLEGKGRLLAVDRVHGVARFIGAARHRLMQQVRNAHPHRVTSGQSLVDLLFHRGDALTDRGHLGEHALHFLLIAGLLGRANRTGGLVALSTQHIGGLEQVAPCAVEADDLVDGVVRKPSPIVVLTDTLRCVAEERDVQHGGASKPTSEGPSSSGFAITRRRQRRRDRFQRRGARQSRSRGWNRR